MISVVGIFCEDIREERNSQDTIVGTLPDNLAMEGQSAGPKTRGMLPKLGLYLRVHLSLAEKRPTRMTARIVNTDGSEIGMTEWQPDVINKAFNDASANRIPVVGFIMKIVVGPFPIPAPGKILGFATVDGVDYVGAALNIIWPATASGPPPERFPSSAIPTL